MIGGRGLRALASALAIVAFAWAMLASARIALSRLLVKYGTTVADAAAIDAATNLTPADAEAHYAGAALSSYQGKPIEALKEFEVAVNLRPRDYYLWLQLGMTRDQLDDAAGALSALNEAVRLAPFYSQPRWQRGNLLFRMGRYDEAFADLRKATTSNPELLPSFIDLAWGASGQDLKMMEQIVQPQNDNAHLALARFFATRKPAESIAQLKAVRNVPDQIRRDLIRQLLTAGAFQQAFEIWTDGKISRDAAKGRIYDGGFEGPLSLDEAGFGWRAAQGEAGLTLSLDANQPHSGLRSLRADFSGISNPGAHIVSQLVMVDRATHYQLNFAVRTRDVVSGGPPLITVSEPTGQRQQLARSASLPQGTSGWRTASFDFTTGRSTNGGRLTSVPAMSM